MFLYESIIYIIMIAERCRFDLHLKNLIMWVKITLFKFNKHIFDVYYKKHFILKKMHVPVIFDLNDRLCDNDTDGLERSSANNK